VKPQAQHEAIRVARERQATAEFKEQYALRAGVESTISQGARRFDLRRCRFIGLAKTHLQQTINATAMNLVRIADWLRKGRSTQPKRPPGHFARLAPPPQFGLAACDSPATTS
jgi:transposase